MSTKPRVGIGGLRRNVEDLLSQLASVETFCLIDQPSLLKSRRPWQIVWQIWRYSGVIDLYYGIGYGQWLRYLFARIRGIPTICHWAGTDVWRIQNQWHHRYWFQWVIRHCITCHLAVADHLVEELRASGIQAKVVPLLSDMSQSQVATLPEKFTILAYLPTARSAFFRADIIYAIAEKHPEWEILIVGRGDTERGMALPNVSELGEQVDLNIVYLQVNALVRIPLHDGLSRMVLEALSWGRYVVYAHPFPHTLFADSLDEVEAQLVSLAEIEEPNDAGAAYVRERFTESRMIALLLDSFREILDVELAMPQQPARHEKRSSELDGR